MITSNLVRFSTDRDSVAPIRVRGFPPKSYESRTPVEQRRFSSPFVRSRKRNYIMSYAKQEHIRELCRSACVAIVEKAFLARGHSAGTGRVRADRTGKTRRRSSSMCNSRGRIQPGAYQRSCANEQPASRYASQPRCFA